MTDENTKSAKQKAAEAEVESYRSDRGPFVVAAEKTRMAMLFMDANASDNPIIFANDSFLSMTGYERDEVLGQSLNFLTVTPIDRSALLEIEDASEGSSSDDLELGCRRKDGSLFWATIFMSPVRDEAGKIVQHFASFVDVTRHKQEAERLRFLMDELNHRTQNTLATVLAIAGQTLHGVAGKDVVDTFEARILALAKAHSLLGQSNWEGLGLRKVIEEILDPFGLHDRRVARFSVDGDDVRLRPKAALTLALVLNELATNASKHGALSNRPSGRVDIAWRVAPTPQGTRLRLQWQESGGPPVTPPSRRGFGSRLIERGLGPELGGEASVNYDPKGIVCEIVLPVVASASGWWSDG
jgi:PAS domain S-box-containing protein